MLNDKRCCEHNLYHGFVRGSTWRGGLAERFKNDPRNRIASVTLDRLSLEIRYFTDGQWEVLQEYYTWGSPIWAASVSIAVRQVEFRHEVRTMEQFLTALLRTLEEQTSLAASSLAATAANTAVSA
jgi:hypothetical protein